jgi:DUF971 family protein
MSQTTDVPWPFEIRLVKDRRTLNVVFDDDAPFDFSAELLRVTSPSAEVQVIPNLNARQSAASGMLGVLRSIRRQLCNTHRFRSHAFDRIFSWAVLHEVGRSAGRLFQA